MDGFDAFEQAVLDKILAGDHLLLATLRTQADGGRLVSRTFSGVGFFFEVEMSGDAPRVSPENFTLGEDVFGEIPGVNPGAVFILFVRDGLLTMLEGVTLDGAWPATTAEFGLRYVPTGRREVRLVEVQTSEGQRLLELPKPSTEQLG